MHKMLRIVQTIQLEWRQASFAPVLLLQNSPLNFQHWSEQLSTDPQNPLYKSGPPVPEQRQAIRLQLPQKHLRTNIRPVAPDNQGNCKCVKYACKWNHSDIPDRSQLILCVSSHSYQKWTWHALHSSHPAPLHQQTIRRTISQVFRWSDSIWQPSSVPWRRYGDIRTIYVLLPT